MPLRILRRESDGSGRMSETTDSLILLGDLTTEDAFEEVEQYAAQYGYVITDSVGFAEGATRKRPLADVKEIEYALRLAVSNRAHLWIPYPQDFSTSIDLILIAHALETVGVQLLIGTELQQWGPDTKEETAVFRILKEARALSGVLHSVVVGGLFSREVEEFAKAAATGTSEPT
jgi:hypothetical protein